MPQFSAPSPDDATTTITTDTWGSDDGTIPSPEGFGGISAGVSEEDLHEFVVMILEIPAVVWGDHLLRTDAQISRFSHQVYVYCEKKGIDPTEYLFDEFGLIFTGAVLVKGMRDDHIAFKKSEGTYKKKEKKVSHKKEKPIVDKEIEFEESPSTIMAEAYTPIEPKPQPKDSGSGGDNLPEKSEPKKITKDESGLPEDAGTIDYGDVEINDETVIVGGIPV